MKISPQEARAAFYRAAKNIEERPETYNFYSTRVEDDCGSCLWGQVGIDLDIDKGACIYDVAKVFEMDPRDIYFIKFPHPSTETEGYTFSKHPKAAAERLRTFADYHWPQGPTESVQPDLTECGMSFNELVRSLKTTEAA